MTLRPRNKILPPPVHALDEETIEESDVVSLCSKDSTDTSIPHITTAPSPNVFNSSDLQRAQAQDADIRRIIQELTTEPHLQSNLASSFIMKNGILHKLVLLTPQSTRHIAVPYLPSSMIQSLLTALHDDPYQGGHFSTDKMISKIHPRYWWPQMRQSIQRHVQACVPCQQFNHSRQKKPGHLHPIPPTGVPFSIIGMDFCGPFAESPRQNKYVLVVTDLFTRFATAVPLPTNTAELTALTLFRQVFCKYGVCSTLITDQGTHFNNGLMRALQHLLGYNHILSTPYHPQTNGVVERFNASFVVQVSKLQQKYHNNWDDYLDAIVFAYNISTHKTTNFSPFQLLYGRSPQLPIDSPPRYFHFARPNDYFVHLQKVLQVYHQQAKTNIIEQQCYNKTRYDRNRCDPHYNLGDRVFTKIFTARGKLDPRFSADPKIIVQTNHPTYVVRHEPTGIEHQYHVSDLRPVTLAYADDPPG
jgi:transposase InsO family protein